MEELITGLEILRQPPHQIVQRQNLHLLHQKILFARVQVDLGVLNVASLVIEHRNVEKEIDLEKNLFVEGDEEIIEEDEQKPSYDTEEEIVRGDTGPLLVVRRICLAPRESNTADWLRNNIFQSTCTIGGKVCKFVIDSGSCENVVSEEVVTKLNLATVKHPRPYKLSWLEKGCEVAVTKKAWCLSLSA